MVGKVAESNVPDDDGIEMTDSDDDIVESELADDVVEC